MTDPSALNRVTAILATCIVQTLTETDPSFKERFLERLAQAYTELRDDSDRDELDGMKLLAWTKELLTGLSPSGGQGEPFLSGR